MSSIIELEDKINYLKSNDDKSYDLFNRIFDVSSEEGIMDIPPDLKTTLTSQFGVKDNSGRVIEHPETVLKRIEKQKIVRTFNKWTGESALFNYIRTSRPIIGEKSWEDDQKQLSILINDSRNDCDFCQGEKYTPKDVFKDNSLNGRVRGKNSITAANLAKYDAWSSLVIFKNHNPLYFNLEEFSDYIDTAFQWFNEVFNQDTSYKFPFFVWNCLYKAGASQVRGHAQILMTKSPYAKLESLHRIMITYHDKTEKNYFQDIFTIHNILGLGHSIKDVNLYASITPIKEKEIIILSSKRPDENENVKKVIFDTLRCFIDTLKVHSYNLAIYCPPLDEEYDFPYMIRIVDRGNIFRPTVDMGGMELFGSTVVADDPYQIIHNLKQYLDTH